jgi:hypothetical protein
MESGRVLDAFAVCTPKRLRVSVAMINNVEVFITDQIVFSLKYSEVMGL